MKTFKLHIIRHGITQGNLDGVYLGCRTDEPLCEEGRQHLLNLQAQFAYPKPVTVFCSPLKRATETADILFPTAQHKLVIDQLKEETSAFTTVTTSRSFCVIPTLPAGWTLLPALFRKVPSLPPHSTPAVPTL